MLGFSYIDPLLLLLVQLQCPDAFSSMPHKYWISNAYIKRIDGIPCVFTQCVCKEDVWPSQHLECFWSIRTCKYAGVREKKEREMDAFGDRKDKWQPARRWVAMEPFPRGRWSRVPTARLAASAPSVGDNKQTARSGPQHTSLQRMDLKICFMMKHYLLHVLEPRLLHRDNKVRLSHCMEGRNYFHFSRLFSE